METPDPPNDTPGALKQVVLTPHDIAWSLRVVENSMAMATYNFVQLRRRNSWSTLLDPGARNKKSELRGESVSGGVGATWRWGKLGSWEKNHPAWDMGSCEVYHGFCGYYVANA